MNCVKVPLTNFALCGNYKNLFNIGIRLNRTSVISHNSAKKISHSTFANMDDIYDPPKEIRGMKVLDRNAIKKTVSISCLIVNSTSLNDVIKIAKKIMLKMKNMKSVQVVDENKQRILIDAKKIKQWEDLDSHILEDLRKLDVTKENFFEFPLEIRYENWLHYELLRAILPEDEPPLSSFSIIGHIVHLNLKDHLLEYKNIIAEILLDKVTTAKTVIYKKNKIDNVYRNFEISVICGEPNFITSVKENGCVYELDFSKVYWNPRLGSEHLRIIELLKERDVLFDVFAGIGPFAIPAAKKRCSVFANDLNPDSVKWLTHNITLNKKSKEYIEVFNQDGADFILNVIKTNLIRLYRDDYFANGIHVVMNLPAIAPTFINNFKGLISENDFDEIVLEKIKKYLPVVHCYFFTVDTESVERKFEESSGLSLSDIEHSFHFVRRVSNSKSMHRVTFTLPFDYLIAECESGEPLPKRMCTECD